MVRQVSRCRHHAPCVARGAHAGQRPGAPAFAGEGDEVVPACGTAAIVTPSSGKAVGKDAALQIFAKGLADIGLGRVVITLTVELPGAGEIKPGLGMLGYRLVQQRALGVARVVELGLEARRPTRMRMRLRWAGDGGHGAVSAWAGCLMVLG